jgi:hypothetical protein
MAQFTQKNIMGTLFETTERFDQLSQLPLKPYSDVFINSRYQHLEPVGMGISGLVWYGDYLNRIHRRMVPD